MEESTRAERIRGSTHWGSTHGKNTHGGVHTKEYTRRSTYGGEHSSYLLSPCVLSFISPGSIELQHIFYATVSM